MKITALLILLALIGSIAPSRALAANPGELNVVGFVKIYGERGKLTLGRSDFEDMNSSGGLAVADLLGDQLPAGSYLYLWNRASASYRVLMMVARGGWGVAGTTRVARGEGFWVRVPDSAASNKYPIYLAGEVPDWFTAPTTTILGVSGMNMLGYPYPAQMKWTNMDIAKKAPSSSILYLWDQSNQAYAVYSKFPRGGWSSAMSNVVLYPGQGFWLRNTGTFDWVEAKPYSWP